MPESNQHETATVLKEKYQRLSNDHFRVALERAKYNLINCETNRDAYALTGVSDPQIDEAFGIAFDWLCFLTDVQITRNQLALSSLNRSPSASIN